MHLFILTKNSVNTIIVEYGMIFERGIIMKRKRGFIFSMFSLADNVMIMYNFIIIFNIIFRYSIVTSIYRKQEHCIIGFSNWANNSYN